MSKETQVPSHDMVQYRERLMSQKKFLTDILSKIEKQILTLQVERLHLRNTLLGSQCSGQEILPDISMRNNYMKTEPVTDIKKNLIEQELDLSVAPPLNEEEIEDDDQFEFLT